MWRSGDQYGGAQTRLYNLQVYVIVILFNTHGGDVKGGCANTLPASTVDTPRVGREAHHLWVIFMSLRAI